MLSLKLIEEGKIAAVKESDIIDSMSNHSKPFDTHAKGKPAIYFRIDTTFAENIGMNEPTAEQFDPARFFAR